MPFDPAQMGDDLDAYFAAQEAQFDDITPGTEKRVIWADAPGARTDWVVLYVHGFSATSEEIRPVPDRVAAALGANLVFTRLTGHGRPGAAMADATAQAWGDDLTEAMEAARRLGERVLIMSTSTGGTLVTAYAQDRDVMQGVVGLILVAPNFGINTPLEPVLNLPGARHWLSPLVGDRTIAPRNDRHATFWTMRYPTRAVFPMVDLIRKVWRMDHSRHHLPALFFYSHDDEVVRADKTTALAAAWGAPCASHHPTMGPEDDVEAHVIAGDILSPGQTEGAVEVMLDWARGLS